MDKLKMQSPNLVEANIDKIAALFPGCITESRDEIGIVRRAVDFDLLRQELSHVLVEGPQERYHLNWPGKNESILTANAPIAKTLRACREESVDFDTTKNIFIEGDNLDALKLLQETYLGKVKMIYIDPPYNTGNDFIYEDDFAEEVDEFLKRSNQKNEAGNRLIANTDSNGRFHSDWLCIMFSRLRLARNLLKEDGVIFISIDDNEAHNLRKICDEVFGADNFLAQIVWQKIHSTKNDAKHYSDTHEYLLCYSKNIDFSKILLLPRTETMDARFTNPDNDPRGAWASGDLVANEERTGGYFDIMGPTGKTFNVPKGKHWVYSEDNLKRMVAENRIWFGKNGDAFPRLKRYLSEVQQGRKADTLWLSSEVGHNQESKREVKKLFDGHVYFDTPKPVRMICRCLALSSKSDDVVLDFFAGSSTTAHAVMQLNAEDNGNRKFIMVQLPEPCDEKSETFKAGYKTVAEVGKERIRRAGKKIKDEWEEKRRQGVLGEETQKNLDIGFRVFKVDTSNLKDVYYTPDALKQENLELFKDHIRPDRTSEDLLFQVFIDWGIDLSLPITKETIEGKTIFIVDTDALVACFDKGITEEFVKKLTAYKPVRVVFRDDAFENDAVKINVEQIFKLLSPNTEVKSI